MPYPANICIPLGQKRDRPYMWLPPEQQGEGDRRVSLIVAPWVDTSSFDRQLLPTQWRPGSIVRVKLYMHASYTPGGKHAVQSVQYARFNLPVLLPVSRTKGLMKTDGSPSRRSHPLHSDLPVHPCTLPCSFPRALLVTLYS